MSEHRRVAAVAGTVMLDNINPEFIRDHVAPLITEGKVPASPQPATPAK